MLRTPFDEMQCSIARTLDVIGDGWTALILRNIAVGITRFDALQRDLGISRKVLSQRLGALVDEGVLERKPYQEKPTRHDYFLTRKGYDLGPILIAMQAWGDRWIFGEENAPVLLRHERCSQLTRPTLTCSSCGEELEPAEITPLPGPGLEAGRGQSAEVMAAFRRLATAGAVRGDAL